MQLKPNTFYQHRYGGLYYLKDEFLTKSTVDKSEWICYKHVFPFEEMLWHRPKEEFIDGRFTELTPDEAGLIMSKYVDEFKAFILANKEAAQKKV